MNRQEKQEQIESIKTRFQKASITLLADYRGLKANDISRLRRELRATSAELKVLKNTLVKIAIKDSEMAGLSEHFEGTIAVVTSEADPVAPAKVLVKFAKEFEKPKIKAGFLSGSLMKTKDIEALAELPSREVMLAKLLGSMNAPAQNLVNVLSAIPRQLVTVLAAIQEKKS